MKNKILILLQLCVSIFFVSCGKTEDEETPRYFLTDYSIRFDGDVENIGSYSRRVDSIKIVSRDNKIIALLPTNIIKENLQNQPFPFDKSYNIAIIANGKKYQAYNTNIWNDSSFRFYTVQNNYRESVDVLYVVLRFKDLNGVEHDLEIGYDGRNG